MSYHVMWATIKMPYIPAENYVAPQVLQGGRAPWPRYHCTQGSEPHGTH